MAGVNSMLFQASLLPMYMMIATQRAFVCNTNMVMGIVGVTGFEVISGFVFEVGACAV